MPLAAGVSPQAEESPTPAGVRGDAHRLAGVREETQFYSPGGILAEVSRAVKTSPGLPIPPDVSIKLTVTIPPTHFPVAICPVPHW